MAQNNTSMTTSTVDLTQSTTTVKPPAKLSTSCSRPKIDTTPIGVHLGPDILVDDVEDEFRGSSENHTGKASWEHVFEQETPTSSKISMSVAPTSLASAARNFTETHVDYIPIGVDLGPDAIVMGDEQPSQDDHTQIRDFQFQSSDFTTPWDHVFGDLPKNNNTNFKPKAPPVKKKVITTSDSTKRKAATTTQHSATNTKPAPTKAKSTKSKVAKKSTTAIQKSSKQSSVVVAKQSSDRPPSSRMATTKAKKEVPKKHGNNEDDPRRKRPRDDKEKIKTKQDHGIEFVSETNGHSGTNYSTHPSPPTMDLSNVVHRPLSTTGTKPTDTDHEGFNNIGNAKPDHHLHPNVADRKRKRDESRPPDLVDHDGSQHGKKKKQSKKKKKDRGDSQDTPSVTTKKSLFLLGASPQTSWNQIQEFFRTRASIDDLKPKKKLGYWRLTIASTESQKKALALSGECLDGNPVVIQIEIPEMDKTNSLFLLGAPPHTSWKHIKEFFMTRASIDDLNSTKKLDYWRLKIASTESQKKALALSGEALLGHPIVIQVEEPEEHKSNHKQHDLSNTASLEGSNWCEKDSAPYQGHSELAYSGTASERTIYISCLVPSVTPFHIQRFFYSQGRIEDVVAVDLSLKTGDRDQEVHGHITFRSIRSYNTALRMSGMRLGQKRVRIRQLVPSPAGNSTSSQSPNRPSLTTEQQPSTVEDAGVMEANGFSPWDGRGILNGSEDRDHLETSPSAQRHKVNREEIGLERKNTVGTDNEVLAQDGGDVNNLGNKVQLPRDESLCERVPDATVAGSQEDENDPQQLDTSADNGVPNEPINLPITGLHLEVNENASLVGGGILHSLEADDIDTTVKLSKENNSPQSIPMETSECPPHGKSTVQRFDIATECSTPGKANDFSIDGPRTEVNGNVLTPTTCSAVQKEAEMDTIVLQTAPTKHVSDQGVLPSKHCSISANHQSKEGDVVGIASNDEDHSQINDLRLGGDDGEDVPQNSETPSSEIAASQSDKSEKNQQSSGIHEHNDEQPREPVHSKHLQSPPTGISTDKLSGAVGTQEAKINSFLEQVHGFQSGENVTSEQAGGDEASVQNSSEDEVEIIDNPRAQPRVRSTCNTDDDADDEVEVVDGPFSTNATRDEPIDLTGTDAKTKRFRPFKPKKVQTTQSDNQTARPRSNSTGAEAAKSQNNSPPERRYVFHTRTKQTNQESSKRTWTEKNFNANWSHEDAVREQERLLRESAARMRTNQAKFQVTQNDVYRPVTLTFSQPLIDVQTRYPDHWKLSDPFTRLGLPKNSPIHLVKTHYRTLARFYHPDKSGSEDTAQKFQAIAEAYHIITST